MESVAAKEDVSQKIKDALEGISTGATLKDLWDLSDESLGVVYQVALSLYRVEDYRQAVTLFQFLCLYDHMEKKFFQGLAACQQMLDDYALAIDTYSYLSLLDAEDPQTPLQAGNCHMSLGNFAEAQSGFEMAVQLGEAQGADEQLLAYGKTMAAAAASKLANRFFSSPSFVAKKWRT